MYNALAVLSMLNATNFINKNPFLTFRMLLIKSFINENSFLKLMVISKGSGLIGVEDC